VAATGTADALTTWAGLSRGHTETNALARSAIGTLGLVVVLVLRVVVPLAAYAALLWVARIDRVVHWIAAISLGVAAAFWAVVALHNALVTF